MRMSYRKSIGLIRLGRRRAQTSNFVYFEVGENSVMPVATAGIGKQSEKHKQVAVANAMFAKMRLRGSGLTERTTRSFEHWVMMTKIGTLDSPSRHLFDDLAEPKIAIRRG
jgi:hypothetical protein